MSSGDLLVLALIVLVPAIALWSIFLFRAVRTGRSRVTLGIPHAMRPGQPDEVLEEPRLEGLQWAAWGAIVLSLISVAVYWFPESDRAEAFQERFDHESVERGKLIFQPAPPLEEDISAVEFKEEEKAIASGMGCANCHGGKAEGGTAPFTDPISGKDVQWQAPPLNNVFSRWDEEVVRFTIERGRPGTPMPPWGVDFGGPMTQQMIDDVMAWLQTIQVDPPAVSDDCQNINSRNQTGCGKQIFEARCAVCHGPEGQGKEDPEQVVINPGDPRCLESAGGSPESQECPKGPRWWQGLALWEGDVNHLDEDQHRTTITNGRRFAFMPQFGEAPAQGIPAPPMPLTEAQIRAVMAYERSL